MKKMTEHVSLRQSIIGNKLIERVEKNYLLAEPESPSNRNTGKSKPI